MASFRPVAAVAMALLASSSTARAQNAGYVRMMTTSGTQLVGESTDAAHYGWIPLRDVTMPASAKIAELVKESKGAPVASESKSVRPPIVVVKDRDRSSLGLLGAMTSHQRFPEVDIVLTKNDTLLAKYKLTDTTVISIRVGGADGGVDVPMEQLRLNYEKIEIVH